jgi:hypothetical protein
MNFRRVLSADRPARSSVGLALAVAGVLMIALSGCGVRSPATADSAGPGRSTRLTSASPLPVVGTAAAGTASAAPGTITYVSPGPAVPPPRPRVIEAARQGTLTEPDNGDTVILRLGKPVRVVLGKRIGFMWDQPVATGHRPLALLRTSASGGYPTRLPARATFVAVRVGRAFLFSLTDAPCLHAKPRCMIAQRLWRVTIIVRR